MAQQPEFFRTRSGLWVPPPKGGLWVPVRSPTGPATSVYRELMVQNPGHRDLWGADLAYADLVRKLRGIPFDACLSVCSMLMQALEHRSSAKKHLYDAVCSALPTHAQRRVTAFLNAPSKPHTLLMSPYAVLYLLKLSAVYASFKQAGEGVAQWAPAILECYFAASDRLNEDMSGLVKTSADAVIFTLAQRSHIEAPLVPWVRAHGLYDTERADCLPERRNALSYLQGQFQATTGMCIQSLITGIALVYWWFQAQEACQYLRTRVLFAPGQFSGPRAMRLAVSRTCRLLSVSLREFRRACGADKRRDDGTVSCSLLPLKRTPLVRLTRGVHICISPSFVANAAIERPIREVETVASERSGSEGIREVRSRYGILFEDYVHYLFRRHFGGAYIVLRPAGRPMGKRADGLLVDAGGFVLVEAKGQRLVEGTRFDVCDGPTLERYLLRLKLGDASKQLRKSAQDLIDGTLADNIGPAAPCVIASVIVCHEDLPVSCLTERAFGNLLFREQALGGCRLLRPQIADIEELEELPSILDGQSLSAFLAEKSNDVRYSLETLRTYAQLRKHRSLSWETNVALLQDFISRIRLNPQRKGTAP